MVFYKKKKVICVKPKKYTVMSMYTQSEKKEKIKDKKKTSFFIFTWSYEQKHNKPYIVICDLSTVLDLVLSIASHMILYTGIVIHLYIGLCCSTVITKKKQREGFQSPLEKDMK